MSETKSLESWLSTKSEVFYLFPAVPTFFMFVLSMITAAVITTGKDDYED
jgi:hypothetical protein